jgi:hypothetical protein
MVQVPVGTFSSWQKIIVGCSRKFEVPWRLRLLDEEMISMLCSRGESCVPILDVVFVRIYNDMSNRMSEKMWGKL